MNKSDRTAAAERLRELAEKATAGPWLHKDYNNGSRSYLFFGVDTDCDGRTLSVRMPKANAAYIAAANPQTILALLQENDALREYANHLYKCRMNNMRRSPFKCTCKLDKLLNQQEGE